MHHRSGILGEVTSRTHRSRRTTTKESLLTVSRETFHAEVGHAASLVQWRNRTSSFELFLFSGRSSHFVW